MSAIFQRGLLLAEQGRNDLAIPEFQRHLATEPGDAFAHAYLALCYTYLEKFEDATRHVREAIQLQPDLAFAHYVSAYILQERNRPEEALAPVQEAIRLDPYFAGAFGLLAQIHLSEKRHQQALEAAEQGLEIDPENVACQNLRAMALKNLGRHNDAAAALDSALERDPENSYTHANKGWALLEKSDPKQALHHFQEALRLEPSNDWAREGIVVALKSRYRIYAWMLKYFLWMSKMTKQKQWMVVIGIFFAMRMLSGLSNSQPALAPFIDPLRTVVMIFAVMTWIADPLFNLALRLNKYGRLALSRDQVNASTGVGIFAGFSLLFVVMAYTVGPRGFYLLSALVFGAMIIPTTSVFNCERGWPRRMMTLFAVVLGALAVTGLGIVLMYAQLKVMGPFLNAALITCAIGFFGGILCSEIMANILMNWRVKK
jgi:tetratricopeptide (TPR) repeat protein